MAQLVIDIDNHLLYSEYNECKPNNEKYKIVGVNQEEIDLINLKYDEGHTIILFTGRSWGLYDITKKQVNDAGIKHHELVMGRPVGVYIDRESIKSIRDLN
jgi:hypothetical protein